MREGEKQSRRDAAHAVDQRWRELVKREECSEVLLVPKEP